jgi:hypothetical protein
MCLMHVGGAKVLHLTIIDTYNKAKWKPQKTKHMEMSITMITKPKIKANKQTNKQKCTWKCKIETKMTNATQQQPIRTYSEFPKKNLGTNILVVNQLNPLQW